MTKTTGRPEWKPTKAQRQKAQLYLAGGLAEPEIAAIFGICQNTLRKHLGTELKVGRAIKTAENLERLEKAAKEGNVSAMKHLDAKFKVHAAEHAVLNEDRPGSKVGKKEEQAAAAVTAGEGTDWGNDLQVPEGRPN